MEKKYESLTLLEFHRQFPDDKACYDYLSKMKWSDGFKCERCDYPHYCNGKFDRTGQCTKCGYQATPTSNTLFHKIKFPILKAMYIVYFVATNKQRISSTELSRKLGLRQKIYGSLKETYQNLKQIPSGKKGENFPNMHRSIMLFKAWLRGTHHAVDHLQAYLDEYTYRFNRSMMKVGIFEIFFNRMVKHKPVYCKNTNIY